MEDDFDKVKASSALKNLLKMNVTPETTTAGLEKKNTNRSANTKIKEDGHGPLQLQSIKYSDKSVDTIANKHNNERLNDVNPSRSESVRESQKGNASSKDGRSFRKEQQNYREQGSFAQKTSKGASSTSFQNSTSDSRDLRGGTNSQRYSSSMKNQKHSAEEFVRKSYDSADSSRKNNSRNPPVVKNQRMDKPFRNTDDRRDYRDKVNSPNRKESRDEKYYAQGSDGNKQMRLGAEKQNKPDSGNQQDSAKSEEDKLTKEFLLSLKENKIKYLPKKNPRFPKANYLCTLCDFHLNIEADCSKHLNDARHLRKKKLHDEDTVLRSIPKPKERQFAALTAAVEKVYTEHGISVEEKKQRADTVLRLEKALKEKIPDVALYMYGSSLTGFGMKTADINVNLISTDKNKKFTTLLKETYVGIKDRTDCGFSSVRPDFTAKVPGLYVTDDVTGLTLSIAIHCYKAHCTSQLLSIYSDFDTRVSKLAVAFRYWAHLCRLDRHLDGYIPPQAFNLMVIYFLQQMSPQLVPIIKPPEVTGEDTGDYKKDSPAFEKMRAKVMKFSAQTRNTMSVGELWFRLLRFYCLEFDTPNAVVSIRTDQQVPRNTKPWNSKKLAVEDPYMLKKNVTGMVNLPHVCEYWEDCIRLALHYFGFPRDAEGKSYIPIDAFMKMIQYSETAEACPPAEINKQDKAIKQPAATDESAAANKKDKQQKTQYSKSSLTKDDQSSLDSGTDDIKDSDTEDSDDEDDGETGDQQSSVRNSLHKQSSVASPAGSNSQVKAAALTKQGNRSTTSLEKQALKQDISDSGISGGLSQTPDNGYIPHQAHASNKSFGANQQQVTRHTTGESSANSSHNDSKDAVVTSPAVLVPPAKESQTDSSHAGQRLSLSGLVTPAEEATDDAIDHLKLTEAMNDIFLLLEQRDCYYVFSKEVLTDGKGPVLLCAYCEKVGHLKNACPDDKLPEMFPLPPLTALHVKVLSETLSRVPGFVGLSSFGSSNRVKFLKDLEAFIRTHFDDANLTLFGSSCNGFGFEKSDMDICLTFSQRKVIDKPWVIESLARKMNQSKELIRVQAICTAKVPIVKFTVRSLGLEGDISLYNILAQHNTRLLLCYSQIDPRVRILGYAIKYFAKVCDIGDASRGSLSSYAYILMMIYYLQQVSPPVVPVLQELYESKEKPQVIVEECNVWFMEDLKKLNTLWSDKGKNQMSVAELWVGFLRFYLEEFNCKEIVVSIRQKELVTRFDKLWNGENIAIEDPFDHSHNLGSGLTRNMNNFIFKTFINGRMLHGSPIDNNMDLFRKYRNPFDYFFDPELLSESRPPNVRGCHFCGMMGHLARQCQARKAQDQQNKQQKPFQQQKQQQLQPQQKQEVLAQEQQESYPPLPQHDIHRKQGQLFQIQPKQQVSLAQSVQQEKQLVDSKQPNLPSQERPKTQQNNNIQVQQASKQTQLAEPVQPKQPETKEFLQQEQQHYNRPLEKQQNQRQVLQPQQEDRKPNQRQVLQPQQEERKRNQRQELQPQQEERKPNQRQELQPQQEERKPNQRQELQPQQEDRKPNQRQELQPQQEDRKTNQRQELQPQQEDRKTNQRQELQPQQEDRKTNQRQVLQPQQEDRKQNQPLCDQQQTLQPNQHQRSQNSQVQQPQRQQRQPLLHQPGQLVQQQDHQVQSSHQKQLPQTQQQIDHFNRQPPQTNHQNTQPFQQQQQRQPPHQQQQISQSLQPPQQLRQTFMPQQHRTSSEQQFRQPFQHQMRHPAVSQQEKHTFQIQQQPAQLPPHRQNQYPQQHPQSQQQPQQYHHSQPQNYHQQQLQQQVKMEAYDSKQEQNQSQKNRTGTINPSPEPAPAFGYANSPDHQAAGSVMHSQVFHNTNYRQQRHHLHQNQHQFKGYPHNSPLLLAPGVVGQPPMLPQPGNFNVFGNPPLLAHPNVMLQPGYSQPLQASRNPGSGYLTQSSHNPGNGFPPQASHNPGNEFPPQASHSSGNGYPPQPSHNPGYGYPTHASHNPGYGYPQHTSHNPGNGYPTQASHNPGNGYPYNTLYNKGPQTTTGMQHSGHSSGDGSLNCQFMSAVVQNMFDSAREQNG